MRNCSELLRRRKKSYSESGVREKPIEEQGSGYLVPG